MQFTYVVMTKTNLTPFESHGQAFGFCDKLNGPRAVFKIVERGGETLYGPINVYGQTLGGEDVARGLCRIHGLKHIVI